MENLLYTLLRTMNRVVSTVDKVFPLTQLLTVLMVRSLWLMDCLVVCEENILEL